MAKNILKSKAVVPYKYRGKTVYFGVINEETSPAFCQVTKDGLFVQRIAFLSADEMGRFLLCNNVSPDHSIPLSIPKKRRIQCQRKKE